MGKKQRVEAPERIWIDGDCVAQALRNRVGSYYTNPSPDDTSNRDVEYVRAQPPTADSLVHGREAVSRREQPMTKEEQERLVRAYYQNPRVRTNG